MPSGYLHEKAESSRCIQGAVIIYRLGAGTNLEITHAQKLALRQPWVMFFSPGTAEQNFFLSGSPKLIYFQFAPPPE